MKSELCELRETIRDRLTVKTYTSSDRQAVVIGLRLGTGFGKTHVLTGFPEWLNACGIYVTYNMNQLLTVDRKHPDKVILIRLTLALHGCASTQCAQFLASEVSNLFLEPPKELLRSLFVNTAKERANKGDIAIGVDELMDLGVEEAQAVVAELAALAAQYVAETKSMCTVLVSSLASATFKTRNGRPVVDWVPSRPNKETFEYFSNCIMQEKRKQAMSLVNAASGGHMRSIVVAFLLYSRDGMDPLVPWMFNQMKDRMGTKETDGTLTKIAQYVMDCISHTDPPEYPPDVEMVSDELHAIPPVFLMLSFEARGQRQHLENLLNAFSLFDGGPGKQLETVSKNYDMFRADLYLPVVPGQARVDASKGHKTDQWYKELRFPEDIHVSEEALLRLEGNGIVATDIVSEIGRYYFPSISNHPWVDRAYVARNRNDKQLCLVLAQDKVNASDFADACDKLNKAASLLTGNSQKLKHVLLIVNVIGASDNTRAQSRLEWPHVLIRGRQEVKKFYTAHFADMVWFARERHLLSLNPTSS